MGAILNHCHKNAHELSSLKEHKPITNEAKNQGASRVVLPLEGPEAFKQAMQALYRIEVCDWRTGVPDPCWLTARGWSQVSRGRHIP